jgi:hypothetical protein
MLALACCLFTESSGQTRACTVRDPFNPRTTVFYCFKGLYCFLIVPTGRAAVHLGRVDGALKAGGVHSFSDVDTGRMQLCTIG